MTFGDWKTSPSVRTAGSNADDPAEGDNRRARRAIVASRVALLEIIACFRFHFDSLNSESRRSSPRRLDAASSSKASSAEVCVLLLGVVRGPDELRRVNLHARRSRRLEVLLDELGRGADDVRALLIRQQVEVLQGADDVLRLNHRELGQVLDAHHRPGFILEDREELPRPVAAVRHQPEVRQRSLRGPDLALLLAQLVREGDEHLPVPLALVRRQRQDARQVVSLLGALLLAEVPDDVVPALVHLAQHVEQEEIHVVVERLVVQEELGEVAQVLAEDLLLLAVNLEKRRRLTARLVAVDLVPGRVVHLRLPKVPLQLLLPLEEVQGELAEEELLARGVLGRKRRKVPRVHLVPPELDFQDVSHLGHLLVLPQRVGVELGVLLVVRVLVLPFLPGLVLLRGAEVHLGDGDPGVQAPVELLVVDVVLVLLLRLLALGSRSALDDPDGVHLAVAPLALDPRADVEGDADAGHNLLDDVVLNLGLLGGVGRLLVVLGVAVFGLRILLLGLGRLGVGILLGILGGRHFSFPSGRRPSDRADHFAGLPEYRHLTRGRGNLPLARRFSARVAGDVRRCVRP
mmetsp:Transcript_13380/g.54017  ORF Transcript_13380/g.54017 Transcript_13380/m.54017 type:complete len:575 (-) Transcript_13380:98-1822(-)